MLARGQRQGQVRYYRGKQPTRPAVRFLMRIVSLNIFCRADSDFNLHSPDELFTAKSAYDCLVSAPFNATVALEFLRYYNDTLQFQSTLAYLKNPPPSYQQPAADLIGSLTSVQQRVQAGEFKNEYEFEVAVQEVVLAAHDDHLALNAGILSAFVFGSPLRIVSVSTDGIELPKIYVVGQ